MDRFAIIVASIGLISCIGCGSGSQVEPAVAGQTASAAVASTTATSTHPTPTDVVSQFLDEVRRGGEDSRANDLLTERARVELSRIGQSIQPIGSPDARFVVTRAESVPGDDSSALVHSLWSEPDGSEIQVVWAVQQEPVGWRISGLAMELEPNQAPVVMDFENAEMMAKLLAAPDAESGNAAPVAESQPDLPKSQAAAPNPTISR
jgi:hypothetical protein